jgi:hypothetical protein
VLQWAPQLSRIRRVEISGFWFKVPGGGVDGVTAGPATGKYAEAARLEVERRKERMEKAVEVLRLASDLRVVILTWKELGRSSGEWDEGWEARRAVLSPLEGLRIKDVRFEIGEIVAEEDVVACFEEYVRELNRVS